MPRGNIAIPVGGLDTSGDAARKPPGMVRTLSNLAIRPGPRLSKRWGFLREGTIPVSGGNLGMFYVWDDERNARRFLIASSADANPRTQGGYRNAAGVWTAFSNTQVAAGLKDAVTAFNKIYGIYDADTASPGGSWSWDGATEEVDPFLVKFEGASLDYFQGRIVIAGPTITIDNKMADADGTAYKFEIAAAWTDTSMNVAVTGNAREVVPSIAAASLVSKTIFTTTRDGKWTYRAVTRSLHATITLPITFEIVNAVTGVVIAKMETELPSASENPDFISHVVTGFARSGTALRVAIRNGNTSKTGVTGVGFVLSESTALAANNMTNANVGHMLTEGEFLHDRTPTVAQSPLPTIYYPSRAYLSQALEPANWITTGWEEMVGIPGALTLVRGDGQLLYFFKMNAIFVYRGTGSNRRAIQPERVIPNYGCYGPKSFTKFEGRWYFIGPNGVFEWTMSGLPKELAGIQRREDMFNSTTVAYPAIAVDETEKEVWCYTQPGRFDIYGIETGLWRTAVIQNAAGVALEVRDMVFIKPAGGTIAEMWVMMAGTNDIVKLRSGQRQDNITGTDWPVNIVWQFIVLDSEDPQQDITLEAVGIRHKITGSQANSTTKFRYSTDDGVTFSKDITVDVNPLSSGGTRSMKVPIFQTADRVVAEVVHSGDAGPDMFNASGAWVEINNHGGTVEESQPTPVASTL